MESCVCNKCGGKIQINIKEEVIDREQDGEEVIEQFFSCSSCNQRYTIFLADRFMREKIAVRKRMRRNPLGFNPTLDSYVVSEMQKHLKELKAKYNKE
ncbi:MAG: hypothetical protein NC123_18905 [Butyrivibrio sp.]|nr:hypothetical protein [Acetatifactor muris]MCM1561582.1 hypothetical protein [Butyrivibrio sp.]